MQKNDVKLFVDLHGLSSKRDSIVDICIDGGKNVNNMANIFCLQKKIEEKFFKNACSVDKYFQAFLDNVMSKWVYSTFHVDAIELEINGAYRWFEGDTQKQSLDLYLTLKEWLEDILK